jgi:hypothetical protein
MVEGYVLEETLGFVTKYLHDFNMCQGEFGMQKEYLRRFWKVFLQKLSLVPFYKILHMNMC